MISSLGVTLLILLKSMYVAMESRNFEMLMKTERLICEFQALAKISLCWTQINDSLPDKFLT